LFYILFLKFSTDTDSLLQVLKTAAPDLPQQANYKFNNDKTLFKINNKTT